MKVTILMGSFRPEGNTATFTSTVIEQLESSGAAVEYIELKDLHIEPCTACWTCQNVFDGPGCPKTDETISFLCFFLILNISKGFAQKSLHRICAQIQV